MGTTGEVGGALRGNVAAETHILRYELNRFQVDIKWASGVDSEIAEVAERGKGHAGKDKLDGIEVRWEATYDPIVPETDRDAIVDRLGRLISR